jgi:hypothetical protein
MKYYRAPWGTSLIVISSLATLLCVGIAIGMILKSHGTFPWLAVLPLAMIFGSALFTVRGYTVTPNAILVQRLFWKTRLSLEGLQSARFEPKAMSWSIRTFGNGGLFSFTGYFRNRPLGAYRAFVTHPRQTVVLRYVHRTVVLSPAAPEEFVLQLTTSVCERLIG